MKDLAYRSTNKEKIKNFLKAGTLAGGVFFGGLLNSSDAYSQNFNPSELTDEQKTRIQRGVLRPNLVDSTNTHYIYKFELNKELESAIKNTSKPELYLTGNAAKGSYAKFNADTSAVELYYSREHFDNQGIGKDVGISLLHEGGSIEICGPNQPGSKTNPLSSFYWYPQKADPSKKQDYIIPIDTIPPQPEKPREGKLEEKVTIIDNSITKTYNYYGDTTKTETLLDSSKIESDYRIIAEAGKFISKPFSFIGASIQRNLGKDFWLGIYGRKNLGIAKKETHEDFNIITPLEPSIGLETNSTGFVRTTSENSRPFEGGLLASYTPGILSFDLGFGAMQDNTYSNTIKKGFDNISQNGKILEQKDFCVLSDEEKLQLNYLIRGNINANILPGVSLGLEGRVNDLFRKPNVESAVKASIELGGRKNKKALIGGKNEN